MVASHLLYVHAKSPTTSSTKALHEEIAISSVSESTDHSGQRNHALGKPSTSVITDVSMGTDGSASLLILAALTLMSQGSASIRAQKGSTSDPPEGRSRVALNPVLYVDPYVHSPYKGSARWAASSVLSKLALNANLWPGLYFSTVLMMPSKYGVCFDTILMPSYSNS